MPADNCWRRLLRRDRAEDARQLAELTRGLPIVLDLIDVNDPTGRFQPPSAAELNAFRDALTEELGMPVVRRYSGGQDIYGGCGMLAGLSLTPLAGPAPQSGPPAPAPC